MSETQADVAIEAMKAAKAQYARGPRNYLKKYGVYTVEFLSTGSKNGFQGLTYWADLKILSAEPLGHPDAAGVTPHAVGEQVTYQENKCGAAGGKGGLSAANRFKGMLGSIVGAPNDEWLDARIDRFIGEKGAKTQGATYLRAKLVVFPKALPKDEKKGLLGKTIEAFKWAAVNMSESDEAAANERRKSAGLPTFAEALA